MIGRLTAAWTWLRQQLWMVGVLLRSGMIAPMRPDKYLGMARILRQHGTHPTSGFALAANRSPDRTALIDERGALTWAELDARALALAVGMEALVDGPVTSVAIL